MSGNPNTSKVQIPVVIELPQTDGETVAELKRLVEDLRELIKTGGGEIFYTEAELAARWGCALITLQRTRREGKIKYKRIGHEIIYSRKHIEEFLNAR